MPATISKVQRRASRILTGLSVAFLLFDAIIKVLKLAPAVQAPRNLAILPAPWSGSAPSS